MKLTIDGKAGRMPRLPRAATCGMLITALGLSKEEALVKLDGKVCPEGTRIGGASKAEVIRVIFGG